MKRLISTLAALVLFSLAAFSQQSSPVPPAAPASPEFLKAADEVLADVSKLISLPVKSPLKKTVRSREEIREYILREVREDRDAAKWDADQKALEKFGLLPRGFDLQKCVVDLLTEQVAGLYDPKGKEFYIADWIALQDQRMVMAHELVHALQDQHFDLKVWSEAARPNDDAELARHSVLEGAAIAGMLEYLLREQKLTVNDMPDLEQLIRAQMVGETNKQSQLARAPAYIRDSLLFPYLAGVTFTQRLLRAGGGWEQFHKVFEKPPASTRQILHPDLYLSGENLLPVPLSAAIGAVPAGWKKLDENTLGEFGVHAVLKQFLGDERARRLSPAWAGDSYAVFEQEKTKRVLLLFRLRLAGAVDAARFFGAYSETLELKYALRSTLFRRPNFFSFATGQGGVFLYCRRDDCLAVEGATRALFDLFTRALRWPDAARPASPAKPAEKIVSLPSSLHRGSYTLYPTP
ncbi:MAG: hypothetical protein HY234_14345 [Acidobacteria bacterium]|nr:hypothetical protein [Acidobacteriota bacterium]MBI3664214.1 hypothetical protein [Acidobacteriota bacterium]